MNNKSNFSAAYICKNCGCITGSYIIFRYGGSRFYGPDEVKGTCNLSEDGHHKWRRAVRKELITYIENEDGILEAYMSGRKIGVLYGI